MVASRECGFDSRTGRMEIDHCPEHGTDEEPWPCPIADEADPPEDMTCTHFADELQRRLHDVTVNGNFFRTLPRQPDAKFVVQEYRNHQPYGGPREI